MQETIAMILMLIIGGLLIIFPKMVWTVAEKWKSQAGAAPTGIYLKVCRIVGTVLIISGILVKFVIS